MAEEGIDLSVPRTIVGLKVDSYMRLVSADLALAPTGLIPIRGMNEQGKSSLLHGAKSVFAGGGDFDLPIHAGARAARVVVKLPDLVIKRTWTRTSDGGVKTALVVENAEGVPQRSPQKLMDSLVSRFADPVEFMSLTPAQQVQVVLEVTGQDKRLRAAEADVKRLYDERRDIGREADRAQRACEELQLKVGMFRLDPPSDTPASLAAELAAADEHNRNLDAVATRIQVAETGKLSLQTRIARLKKELAEAEASYEALCVEHDSCTAWLKGAPGKIDLEPIKARMAALSDYAAKRANLDTLKVLEDEAKARKEDLERAEKALADAREVVDQILAEAKFPVEGMSYSHESGNLLLKGIPFAQASHAERVRVSAAIAMSGKHSLKVVFIKDGSLLDTRSLGIVAEMAQERGYQVLCEIVDSNREGAGVWIEDGEAFQASV